MKARVVSFDFGNTLLTSPFEKVMKLQGNVFYEIFKRYGYDIPKENIIYTWRSADSKVHYEFISHFFQERKIVMNMLDRLNVKENRSQIVSELLVSYRQGLMAVIKNSGDAEKARMVLTELKQKGKRLAVLSSERTGYLNTMLEWMGIKRYFEKIIATESIGIDKPDPRIFWFLLRSMNVKRDDVVHIGDSYFYDIVPAKKFGIRAVWLNRGNEKVKTENMPDAVIRRIEDIIHLIE